MAFIGAVELGKADRLGAEIGGDRRHPTLRHQGHCENVAVPLEFIADRKVDVERLFTDRWRLEQAEEAYRLFDTQTTGKAVILPS